MKKQSKASILVVVGVLAFAGMVLGQTSAKPGAAGSKPSTGPRTADGKPDLTGIWGLVDRATGVNRVAREESSVIEKLHGPLPRNEKPALTPWGQERLAYNTDPRQGFGSREELDPAYHCVPYGPAILTTGASGDDVGGYEIIQSAKRVLIIYERDHNVRQVWMDGRKHPATDELEHTWMGHSIGSWDGDTLVVDTVGIRNEPWLDGEGHVSSKQLHMVERYKRLDKENMLFELTLTDLKVFTKPWTRRWYRRLRDWELAEDVRCYPGSPELRNEELIFSTGTQSGE